jgi:hypothetical protein
MCAVGFSGNSPGGAGKIARQKLNFQINSQLSKVTGWQIMPAAPSTRDKIYSGRTDTLSNTHRTASNASGNPITSQTPIFGFISYPLCFRH